MLAARSRAEGPIVAFGPAAVGCPESGRLVAARWPADFAGLRGARCVFALQKPLAGGHPRTPARHSRATRGPPDMVCPRKRVRSRDGMAAARDHRVPPLRGDAEQPGGQLVGERVLRRPEAALDTLPGPRLRGPSAGCSSRRRGGGDRRGSEGARPPASLRRGRTECGHGGYAGLATLAWLKPALRTLPKRSPNAVEATGRGTYGLASRIRGPVAHESD